MQLRKILILKLSRLTLIYKLLHFLRDIYYHSRYYKYRKKYNLSKSFTFNGVDIEMYAEGQIIIGNNTYIGNRSVLTSNAGCYIKIGDNCAISHNVRIYTANRDPDDIISVMPNIKILKGNVIIGNNVWIGANVFINQDVTIGDNCVIGANSVITKNIPSRSNVVGANRIIKS